MQLVAHSTEKKFINDDRKGLKEEEDWIAEQWRSEMWGVWKRTLEGSLNKRKRFLAAALMFRMIWLLVTTVVNHNALNFYDERPTYWHLKKQSSNRFVWNASSDQLIWGGIASEIGREEARPDLYHFQGYLIRISCLPRASSKWLKLN